MKKYPDDRWNYFQWAVEEKAADTVNEAYWIEGQVGSTGRPKKDFSSIIPSHTQLLFVLPKQKKMVVYEPIRLKLVLDGCEQLDDPKAEKLIK
ncbi:hypothetical protein HDU88_004967 [Geranomyces variabilis]|nr:hypothetical protein HDU88_004967 [Geranomyces variabilis]